MNFKRKSILSMIKLKDGVKESFRKLINNLEKILHHMIMKCKRRLWLLCLKRLQRLFVNNWNKLWLRKKEKIKHILQLKISWMILLPKSSWARTSEWDHYLELLEVKMMEEPMITIEVWTNKQDRTMMEMLNRWES